MRMGCFYYFKDRGRRSMEQRKSAAAPEPELKEQTKSNVSSSIVAAADNDSNNTVTKSSSSATSSRSIPELYEERAHNLQVFSFAELKQATNNFNRLLKIGEGGFGSVYKGLIKNDDEQIVVAIKKLNTNGSQGHKQWVAEVQFLGVVEHPNLVKLIGYCAVDGQRGIQRLLVYEFMSNKSLEDHIFGRAYPSLPWQTRLQIALGAAQGLAYLHEELERQVIYRDFKSSNVLLDEDFNPKLSDFGLAREGPTAGHTHVSTAVVGTFGYAAPDYVLSGHLTAKSDVWTFGVVLYEILTGRRSLETNRPKSEQKLLAWVKQFPADSKKFGTIIDPRLENQYSLSAARRTAKLADSCLLKNAKDRPKMSEAVETLKQIILDSVRKGPSENVFESEENEIVDDDDETEKKKGSEMRPSESAIRRVNHLAKLSEHVGGINGRRFMMTQKINVT